MKPHLIIRLAPRAASATATAPAWSDAVRDKSDVGGRLHPDVDRVLDRHRVGVWVTAEYRPRDPSGRWTAQELESGLNRVYRLILQDNREIPPGLVEDISLLPVVEQVRPGLIARSELPRASALSGDDRTGRAAIGLDEASDYTRGDKRVLVAVLDTGIDLAHPELADSLRPGRDFVDILDGAGKRFGAWLLDNINSAVKWAVDQGADVINMSLGVRHEGGGLPHREVVDYARRNGVTIVAASGNDGRRELYYPGALPHVIAVGAADNRGRVSSARSSWPTSTWPRSRPRTPRRSWSARPTRIPTQRSCSTMSAAPRSPARSC
ncbi:S8 family serine peptidase [Skermanella rosea]|uniref:S8 family peptidase n=1 Tax=Skermanella rosea TaxID=1817965 RepID=UPI00193354D8|nr:S8 family serine peptidase [Skermanella rosea]UEM04399.1 S8 family serine peptidase [Skermanella rosea]